MSHELEPAPTLEAPPLVPKRVRTVAYWVLFTVGAVALLAPDLAHVWIAEHIAQQVDATSVAVLKWAAVVAGGLGVAYRPTRA